MFSVLVGLGLPFSFCFIFYLMCLNDPKKKKTNISSSCCLGCHRCRSRIQKSKHYKPQTLNLPLFDSFIPSPSSSPIYLFPKLMKKGPIKFQRYYFFKKRPIEVQKSKSKNHPISHNLMKLVFSKTNTTIGITISKSRGIGPF